MNLDQRRRDTVDILFKIDTFIIMILEENAIYTSLACNQQLATNLLPARVVVYGTNYQITLKPLFLIKPLELD